MKPWQVLRETELLHVPSRLRVTVEHVRLPDGREVHDYLQLQIPPFVVIVAQTKEGHILCERQYKHGPRRQILTLPAGSIEPGEEALAAAKRELLEETGYASDDWETLASHVTQANAGGSWTHSFLARNCHKVCAANSGDLEEMVLEDHAPAVLLALLSAGEMPLVADAAALLYGLQSLGILKRSDSDTGPIT